MSTIWGNRLAALFVLVFAWGAPSQTQATPEHFSAEQEKVYHDFLADYMRGSKRVLNLAERTFILQPDDGDYAGCMHGFPRSIVEPRPHHFDQTFAERNNVRLVDPATHQNKDPEDEMRDGHPVEDAVNEGFTNGLFSISEIIFDAAHHRAALRYGFSCGRFCGQSETVVLEKREGVWKRAKASCGYAISQRIGPSAVRRGCGVSASQLAGRFGQAAR